MLRLFFALPFHALQDMFSHFQFIMTMQEQVQLNVALQTEIVRFTVLGIQKAIRDVEESMLEQERLSTGGTSFFVSFHLSL